MPYVSMPNCWPASTLDVPCASADGCGARGEQAGLAAVSAARAEIHDLAALGGRDHARGFAGDHGLVAERGEKICLHDLRLR